MDELLIRPTRKFLRLWAGVVGLAVLGVWAAYFAGRIPLVAIPALFSLVLFSPLAQWLRVMRTFSVLTADRLRSETGIVGKSTHSLILSRIQDVGVNQTVVQRIFNVGDVWIESAGTASRIALANVDNPHRLLELILEGAKRGA